MKHSENIKAQNKHLSAEQIRANKNTRCRERNAQRRADKYRDAEERNAVWRSLTLDEQKKQLALRPGQCKKQLARIEEQQNPSVQ